MKITKSQLKQIIKEELNEMHEDDETLPPDEILSRLGGEMGGGDLRGLDDRKKVEVLHEALLEIEAYRQAYDQAMDDEREYEESEYEGEGEDPLRISAPGDPWKFKRRAGIGRRVDGSQRVPRHRELDEMQRTPLAVPGGRHDKIQGYHYDEVAGVHVSDHWRSFREEEVDAAIKVAQEAEAAKL